MSKYPKQEFDYVIIGAGSSAIGLLFGLLEQFKDKHVPFTVAVVERGQDENDPTTRSPRDWYKAAHASNSKSAKQIPTNITGRAMDLPIGKGLGGTSNINACLCTSALDADMDAWPKPWKDTIIPYSQYIQSILKVNGAIDVKEYESTENIPRLQEQTASLEISPQVTTMAVRGDDNSKIDDFLRKNYYDGLLEPLLKRHPGLNKNLHWILDTEVQRIILDDGNIAKGVICSSLLDDTCSIYKIMALKEVILCAGAIESPALMLTSEIKVKGVGQHLRDQVLLSRTYLSKWKRNNHVSTSGISGLGHLRHLKGKIGLFQIAIVDSTSVESIVPAALAMAVRKKWDLPPLSTIFNPIMDILFLILKGIIRFFILYSPLGYILRHFSTTVLIFLMHPDSYGSICLKPKRKRDENKMLRRDVDIEVNIGYLKDKRDIEALRSGWKACTKLVCGFEVFPTLVFEPLSLLFRNTVDWFPLYCNNFSQPYYHFCGSCGMKTDQLQDDWVVDVRMKVRDHSHLRVCDASVFPSTISSPPALTCVALGYGLGLQIAQENRPKVL